MENDKMTPEQKKTIDDMPYEAMLRLWRNSPIGNSMFSGETGKYFSEVMNDKRAKVGNDEHVRASKNIGWDG